MLSYTLKNYNENTLLQRGFPWMSESFDFMVFCQ